jgi:ATP-binding cassette, subfamily B, bacterial
MKKQTTTSYTLRTYWQHTKKYSRRLLFIYPSMAIAQLAEDMLSPLLISGLLTSLAAGNFEALALGKIWPVLMAIIAIELLAHVYWNVIIRAFWRTQDAIMRDLNMTVFDHLSKMSYRFFSNRFAGSLVNQTNKFVGSYERLTDPLTWNVFKLLITLGFTVVVLWPKAPLVVVVILALAAVYTPLVWMYRRRQVPFNRAWAEAETKRTGQVADAISNVLAVKSFANEPLELSRMQERVDEVHSRSIATMRENMRHELVTGFFQRNINIATIILSIILAVNGIIEVGIIYLALNYTSQILKRLWDLNNTFRQFTRVFGDASDMAEILQIEPEVADPLVPLPFAAEKGDVTFTNVTFWYKEAGSDKALFNKLNIAVKSGEKIGLVGPSGGGKTTVTKLLLRFMDIQDGVIEIDGQDISKSLQADVRKAITYVPQEPLLFHRSLSENIAYGKLGASQEEIEAAAKKAHAHEFIEQLKDGYETLVGERGVKLSGGQRQRVAIARAMIKNAPILVLDEATSALDSESEKLIQEALWKLMEGKTAIVIAHRLSTIQHMDRIIVLDKGKVVEEGSHQQLVKKKNGLYAKLWSHQSGGFLEE